jgi:hypothetical protein
MRRPSLASSGVISAVRKTIGTPCSIQSDSPELRTVSPTANRPVSSLMIRPSSTFRSMSGANQMIKTGIDPFQSETLPAGRERERRLLDLSYPAKERQCEVPLARHDGARRHPQWLPFSSDAPARWPKERLAQSRPEAERSCAGRGRRHRHASDYTCGRKTETYAAGRSAQSSRCPEGEKIVVGHHAYRAQRLDPMDHLSQTTRDSHPPDQECLLDARGREATRLLLRPVWVVQ